MAAQFNPKAMIRMRLKFERVEERAQIQKRKWFRNNYERVYLNPSLPEDKIPKKAAVLFNQFLRLEKDAEKLREERLKQTKVLVEEPVEKKEEISVAELLARGPMYPVHKDVKETLYHGISHNDEGKRLYLKLRNKQGVRLEDKFYRPLTESQLYGWEVQERYIPAKRYGRKAIIKQSFLRRNGVMKFDSHFWRVPQTESVAGYLS